MFKPGSWQSHDEYRTIVNTYGHRLSRNNPRYHFDLYYKEQLKLLSLNLDPVRDYIAGYYSNTGRPAKNQAQILHSPILFVLLFNKMPAKTSLTVWVCEVLPASISLVVLCGVTSSSELPPLGSYYDLMNHLWLASRERYSRHKLFPTGKNGKKPDKVVGTDGKLEENDKTYESTRSIVDTILRGRLAAENPEAALQEIFSLLAVLPSMECDLVDSNNLTLSGDSTAVVSHSSSYGKHLSSCSPSCPYRHDCGRYYSDPDAEWRWDSDNKCWYFEHTCMCSAVGTTP